MDKVSYDALIEFAREVVSEGKQDALDIISGQDAATVTFSVTIDLCEFLGRKEADKLYEADEIAREVEQNILTLKLQ